MPALNRRLEKDAELTGPARHDSGWLSVAMALP